MVRNAKIYMGNAAEFTPEKYHDIPGVTVNEDGDVFDASGEKIPTEVIKGYKRVRVVVDGKERPCKVHRIVASTFPDICGEFNQVVNHLDEDKFNNKASNLRWVSVKENNTWGTAVQRRKETVKRNSTVKELVKEYYERKHIVYYPKNIVIKKLKYRYKVMDKENGTSMFIPFEDVEKRLSGETEPPKKKPATPETDTTYSDGFNFSAYYRDYQWICRMFDKLDRGEL